MRRDLKPNVTVKKVKGREYHYYRVVRSSMGERSETYIRIKADPGTAEYDEEYWKIRTGKKKAGPSRTSYRALVDAYMKSRRYKKLADGTKRKYRPILDAIREKNGHKDATLARLSDIEAIHDKYADTPRKADWYVQILSILFNHAIRMEWMKHNPTKGIELFGAQRSYEPWPEWFQKEYVARAEGPSLTVFFLGAGTGQRASDLCKMEWDHWDGQFMSVTQDKTEERLRVYCPQILRDYLAREKRIGRHILAKNLTEHLSYDAIERRFRNIRTEIAKQRPDAKNYSLHGLRVLAAVEMAEAGCSDAEIQAVLGHRTVAMAAKYRARAASAALTMAAQKRREQKWGEA